jgi:hypothetical protein
VRVHTSVVREATARTGGHGRHVPRFVRPVGDPLGHHVTMRLSDDRVIALTAGTRRIAARVLLEHGHRHRLLAFRVADTHAHVLLACDRREAGAFALYAESALRQRLQLPVGFEPARVRPIGSQRHLTSAFRYVLRQEARHGIHLDAAHDASSLPDLLGLRVLPASPLGLVQAMLPRLRREELLAWLEPGTLDVAQPSMELLADAAAAALGLPDLDGRSDEHVAARCAAVRVAGSAPTAIVAALLGISARGVQALRKRSLRAQLASVP